MTEEITIDGGRLRVARAAHKNDVDVDLSNVESVHFERAPFGEDGALVIREKGSTEDTVIRVDNEDAPEVYDTVLNAIPKNMELGEEEAVNTENKPVPAEAAVARADKLQGKQGRKDGR